MTVWNELHLGFPFSEEPDSLGNGVIVILAGDRGVEVRTGFDFGGILDWAEKERWEMPLRVVRLNG